MSELPPELSKEYGAPFAIISHMEGSRYTSLISRDFSPPRCLDFGPIVDVTKAIEAHCRTLSFQKIVKMKHDAYQELMLEFLTDDDAQFSCRLMGRNVTVTCKTLRDIFGFRKGGHKSVPKQFNPLGFWKEISDGRSDFKSKASSGHIKDPILRIMHRYISQAVFGRVDSCKVTLKDLFYLSCLRNRVDVATPCFLIHTFNNVVTNKRANMCLGNFITAIALHFGAFDPTGMKVLPTRPLCFTAIKSAIKAAKEVASSSSQDTDPVAFDDQSDGLSTTPPAVDSWMLISRQMEQMQTRMNDGFNDLKAGFDGLEKKVNAVCAHFQTFQREWSDFRPRESNDAKNVEKLNRGSFVANTSIKKLRPEKSESDKAAEIYKTSIEKLAMRIKKIEDGLGKISSLNVVGLANLLNELRELGTFEEGENLEFPDSRGKNNSLGNGSMPDADADDEAEHFPGVRFTSNSIGSKGLSKNDDSNSLEPLIRDGDIAHAVKNSPCPQTDHNLPQPGSDECKAPRDIIEILDSDDETNHNGAVESSIRVPSSDEIDLVRRRKRNRTESMEYLLPFSTTKEKKEVCTVDEKNALIYEKETEVLKSSHGNVDWSRSGRYVEETRDSQNGLNDEVSADSKDQSLSDSRMEDLIASLRREKRVRKFMYEADMLRAFQQDEMLCLNAVCALYRQTLSANKSDGCLALAQLIY